MKIRTPLKKMVMVMMAVSLIMPFAGQGENTALLKPSRKQVMAGIMLKTETDCKQ